MVTGKSPGGLPDRRESCRSRVLRALLGDLRLPGIFLLALPRACWLLLSHWRQWLQAALCLIFSVLWPQGLCKLLIGSLFLYTPQPHMWQAKNGFKFFKGCKTANSYETGSCVGCKVQNIYYLDLYRKKHTHLTLERKDSLSPPPPIVTEMSPGDMCIPEAVNAARKVGNPDWPGLSHMSHGTWGQDRISPKKK